LAVRRRRRARPRRGGTWLRAAILWEAGRGGGEGRIRSHGDLDGPAQILQQHGPVSWPCLLRRQVDPVCKIFTCSYVFYVYKIKLASRKYISIWVKLYAFQVSKPNSLHNVESRFWDGNRAVPCNDKGLLCTVHQTFLSL